MGQKKVRQMVAPSGFAFKFIIWSGKSRDRKSIGPETQTEEGHSDSFLEKDHRSERLSDLLQHLEEVEEQKTETGYQKQSGNKEPQKEDDLLSSCAGLHPWGDEESLRGMEQCKKD